MSRVTVATHVGQNYAQLEAVGSAAGIPPQLVSQHVVTPLPCVLTNMTTADLARVRFGGNSEAPSLVVKIAQSPRHSPLWAQIPEQFREEVIAELPWRAEAELYASRLESLLPDGLRMPAVYAVEPLEDDHIAMWMEDVVERSTAWDREDYRSAARALGRMAGRLPEDRIPADIPVQRRDFRKYVSGRITHGTLPALRADATWRHPLVAEATDPLLRRDLESLVDDVPALLDRLDELPRTLAHGDACPQNLLRPVGEPATIVALDWTFVGITALGQDAAQLVAGRAESGELDPADLSDVLDEVVECFADGVLEEAGAVDRDAIQFGVVANLVIRSAFTAVPVELLGDVPTDQLVTFFDRRLQYARFLVDLGLALLPGVDART